VVRVRRDGQASVVAPDWTGEIGSISLSPDGRQLALDQVEDGRGEIWVKTLDTGPLARVASGGTLTFRPFWFPDGRSIGFLSDMSGRDLTVMEAGIDSVPRPLIATEYDEYSPAISPDGRWLAYGSNLSGRDEVYVKPFPHVDGGRWQVSIAGGTEPTWSMGGVSSSIAMGQACSCRRGSTRVHPSGSCLGSPCSRR
jgi:Tol biopolymer transport system component